MPFNLDTRSLVVGLVLGAVVYPMVMQRVAAAKAK